MATINNVSTNYVGKIAQGYLTAAMKSGDTIAQNLVRFESGLKEKGITMRRLSAEDLIKGSTCNFTPDGTLDLDYRQLIPKKLQVQLEFCKEDFEGAWEAEDMGDSAHDNLSQPYINALVDYVLAKVAEGIDKMIWQGEGDANSFKGILPMLANDTDLPGAQKIAGTSITAQNVATELGKVVDAIPDQVLDYDSDLVIVTSSNVARKYIRALAGFGADGQGGSGYQAMGYVGRKPLDFDGIPIFVVGGMPSESMAAYRVENIAFGTGTLNDYTSLKILDLSETTGDDIVRINMKFIGGIQYGFADEVVVYGVGEFEDEGGDGSGGGGG